MGVGAAATAMAASLATTMAGAAAQVVDGGSTQVAPLVTGAGALSSGGIITYVFYQFVRGNILSKPIAEHIAALTSMIAANSQMNAAIMALREDEVRRQESTQKHLDEATRVMARLDVQLGGQGSRRSPRRNTT